MFVGQLQAVKGERLAMMKHTAATFPEIYPPEDLKKRQFGPQSTVHRGLLN